MQVVRFGRVSAVLAILFVTLQAAPAHAALSSQELKCAGTIKKSFAKLQSAILKETTKCRAADISGKTDDPSACNPLPADAQSKVDTAREKFVSSVAKACKSTCSVSNDKECVSDITCPPNNATSERCTGKGGTTPFRVSNLGFPGPYCDAILGHAIASTNDLGACLVELVSSTTSPVIDELYADQDENSDLSDDAQKCLSSIGKAVTKTLGKVHGAVADCHDELRSGNSPAFEAHRCATSDPDTAETIAKEMTKLTESIAKSCTNATIGELDGLCASGGTVPGTVADAQACISDLVSEIAAGERGPTRHVYSRLSMVNITHPESAYPYCGDGFIYGAREEHTGVGEECDGDDTPCGTGSCLPPGDLFECTCDSTPRERLVIDGDAVDSDAGWTGDSHDAVHNDGFGYVSELSDCNCSEFTQATCTGTSSDSVCNVFANMAPRCSDDMGGTETCDERGDNDGIAEASDCFVCDDNSINAGTYCGNGSNPNETVCQGKCFDDLTGSPVVPQDPCERQADCGEGQTCKGRCDNTVTCERMTEGSPLPLVSAAVPVCISLEFVTDLTGTKNIVTGESEVNYTTRSIVQLGDLATQPCPICGATCVGGSADAEACSGRCDMSDAPCLLDADCVGPGDTACLETDDDCPGGSCSLDLRCNSGDDEGDLCHPDAVTPLGIVSADCSPNTALNLSGTGIKQPFGNMTTEAVAHPVGSACSDAAWANFTCACPDDGSLIKTKPNNCAGACDAGPREGYGCATGNGSTGEITRCDGGSDDGEICDQDSDCGGGGTCSDNPEECTAGKPNLIGQTCLSNAACDTTPGSGDGVCGDSCPGGRCLPLCYPEGTCTGGTRDGDACATDRDCGGGVCNVTDSEDGLCAAGPLKFRCTGAGYTSLPCSPFDVDTQKGCEAGNDGILGNTDDIPGAGVCESRPQDCFVNNGAAEGGDTLNGGGSPSEVNLNAAFCTPKNGNSAIDGVSGFGGPSRIRREGAAFVNVPSIP